MAELIEIKGRLQRLKETGVIDGFEGNIGLVLDFFNKSVDEEREKDFQRKINDRNLYYYKLWWRALQDAANGGRAKVYTPEKKDSIIIT